MLSPLLPFGFDGVVASCGGYIRFGNQVIYDCPMTEEQKVRAMNVLKKNGVFRTVECMNGSYTDEGFKEFLESHGNEGGNSELLRWRRQVEDSLNIRPMAEYQGQRLELTKNDYRILQTLMENKGKVVSRDTLMTKLWQADCYVEENTLTVNVTRLRKKLENIGLTGFIATKIGSGYIVE